jgi:CRISPR-associated protein Cas2
MQFVVVSYDISDDRRRTRLHDLLLQYGSPVQYSVFECLLEPARLAAMKRAVRQRVRPRVDQVRFYPLCQACLAKVQVVAGKPVLGEVESIVV